MERLTSRPFRVYARTFGLGALVLLFSLGGVWLVESVWGAPETDPEKAKVEVVSEVQERIDETLEHLEHRAAEVARNPALARSLEEMSGADLTKAAFSVLREARPAERFSLEIYDASLDLIAWNGFVVPLRREATLPDTVETHAVLDGSERRALVVWVPVWSDSTIVGAVRAALLVQASVPVRNEYLQDYDVADRWRAEIGEHFQMAIVPTRRRPAPAAEALLGVADEIVGWVLVSGSSSSISHIRRGQFFEGLRRLLAFLLMTWGMVGVGLLFFRAVQISAEEQTHRHWIHCAGTFFLVAGAVIAFRIGMLSLDIPVRWLDSIPDAGQFFNPATFGSNVGWGLMRSPGDLAISALFAFVIAGAGLTVALQYASIADRERRKGGVFRIVASLVAVLVVSLVATGVVGVVARHSVLDATLRYFDQTGPALTGLFVVVLGSQVLLAAAGLFGIAGALLVARVGLGWMAGGWLIPAAAMTGAVFLAAVATPFGQYVPPLTGILMVLISGVLAFALYRRSHRWMWPLTFRGIFLGVLVIAPLTYGLMRGPLEEQRDARLAEAARSFSSGRDNRVLYGLEQMFVEARSNDALRLVLLDAVAVSDSLRRGGGAPSDSARKVLDELASGLATGSLLGSLSDVAVELQFVSPAGDTLGGFVEGSDNPISDNDPLSFERIHERYLSGGEEGNFVQSAPFEGRRGVKRYASLGPVGGDATDPRAWIYVRATPRPARFAVETPFPRVLVPAEELGLGDERFTYAEYEDGVLVRSQGAESAPFRLDTTVVRALEERAGALWSTERVGGARVRSFYEQIGQGLQDVVAVRAPARGEIDTLFLLFRIALSGLIVGGVVFLFGLPVRRRAGQLPAPQPRFRDKVLNRFLVIGLLSVLLTGVVGQHVLSEQNRQAVEDLLRQRLDRAEVALTADASSGASADYVLIGTGPEALIGSLGFDVHLYRGADLLTSSRRQLVQQRLIDSRLPAGVYQKLFLEGEPYAYSDNRIGTFRYTTGYRALPDSTGMPIGVIAVPTLPEQATIEAGQARMVAYLFGGLLVLMLIIVGIGMLLAGQLTRPFERLREGLEAVGEGRLDEPIPVETRDEVGQLAESFNTMQDQLAESRRLLVEQERETAWSEMARQVAHEIKNPLMPMLLAVQHLQRMYQEPDENADSDEKAFSKAFKRTTQMLIEQIESLKHIASEFSIFARLPERHPEPIDLNEVAKEAARLFQSETLGSTTNRVVLGLDLAKQSLPVVADREEMRRVFVNLLTNAFQSLDGEQGEISLRAESRETSQGSTAVVEVVDTGHGIEPEARARIFQPSFSTKTSGMGMGLAIAKRSVEAAGGTIGFNTIPGNGTTFWIHLPMQRDENG